MRSWTQFSDLPAARSNLMITPWLCRCAKQTEHLLAIL